MTCRRCFPAAALLILPAAAALAREPAAAIVRFPETREVARLADALSNELRAAGYTVADLDAAGVCEPAQMTREKLDLLVLPDGSTLPADAIAPVERFLQAGGDIIALNAPLWQRALLRIDGRWMTYDEYCIAHAGDLPQNIVVPWNQAALPQWVRSSNHPEFTVRHEIVDGPRPGLNALHVTLSDLQGWETLMSPQLSRPFPEGHTLTVLTARGGPRTDQLSVEWRERDGTRWIAVAPLRPHWQLIVLEPGDFNVWPWTSKRGKHQPFNPREAVQLTVGLAFSHTGQVSGRHEYWLGPIGTAALTPDYQRLLETLNQPKLDTLSPNYKLFDCNQVAVLDAAGEQAVLPQARPPLPRKLRSPQPRAQGHGFAKGRKWRWIPLLEARTADGQWRGTPATLLAHFDGPHRGGLWASFGIADPDWYAAPQGLEAVGRVARRMRDRLFMVDGGSNFYTYFEGQELTLGITAANLGSQSRSGVVGRVVVADAATGREVLRTEWPLALPPGETATVSAQWKPDYWPAAGFRIEATLLAGEQLIDRLRHEAHVWRPNFAKRYITVKDGDFQLGGRRWRAHGVNYMPSSGIGTEDGSYFEHWFGARSYDPEVIQRDLERVRGLGMNAVSIFIDHPFIKDQNFLDILRRIDLLGLKANVSLRPNNPMHFNWPVAKETIERLRLAEHDAIFAFDLAWEPMFRGHSERLGWDRAWEAWIVERYGSLEAAEKDWAFKLPRDSKGAVTNPLAHQVDTDGEWRRMTAAYRRFLDTLLYQKHAAARRLVRSIDPHHLVSFRMAEAGNPTMRVDGWIAYDFPYLAAGVDMLAPEAYGRIGDWDQVRPGLFEEAYGRWAAPDKPLIWAEAGVSAWDLTHVESAPQRLQFQADHYRAFYRMLIAAGSDGVFFWWYPGGFRVGENSDFGIINPDGSDRPVTRVIREHAQRFLNAPGLAPPDTWIEFDRDAHPDGIAGVYDAARDAFWTAIDAGRVPGLRTAGTATDSANCPQLAVGNVPCSGSNPPKYLDAAFDVVELRLDGEWTAIEKGGSLKVPSGRPLKLRAQVTNLGEAGWVAAGPGGAAGAAVEPPAGSVRLSIQSPAASAAAVSPLIRPVPHFGAAAFDAIELPPLKPGETRALALSLEAVGRTPFGERFAFNLIAE